ncbi:MAG: hypothetical protein H0W50_09950 [Parachlamydiaceae bacterium]|nr:hypothetical protein [Parachlamydiaceae bacterium]
MLTLAIILVIVAMIAGLFSFGITNIINQIAKFIFIILVIFLLLALFYGYSHFRSSASKETLPQTEVPVLIPIDRSIERSTEQSAEEISPESQIIDN